MKKIIYLAAAFLMAACSGDKVPAEQGSSDFFHGFFQETGDDTQTDSLDYTRDEAPWRYSVTGEYPQGKNTALVRAVREWISEQLGGTYEGDLSDAQALCAHYAQQYIDDQGMDLAEQFREDSIECYNHLHIDRVWENDQLVTYLLTTEWYGGGAHGAYLIHGATFRKSDGRRFGMDMLRENRLPNEELVTGLKAYFEVDTDEALVENLMLPGEADVNFLPMPTTAPWIEADGLHLVYQQYEIACYAAGLPAVVVPTDRLSQFVTATMNQSLTQE